VGGTIELHFDHDNLSDDDVPYPPDYAQYKGITAQETIVQFDPPRLLAFTFEGDRNGGHPKATRALFKDWIRGNYPAIYIEYKGRSSEMFLGEIPNMMDWMSRKKRMNPTKGMGRYHMGDGVALADQLLAGWRDSQPYVPEAYVEQAWFQHETGNRIAARRTS